MSTNMQAKINILKESANLKDKKVAIFVSYNNYPLIKQHVTYHLKSLKTQGFTSILVLVTDNMDDIDLSMKTKFIDALIIRSNNGHDFGAWADAFRSISTIWDSSEILLVNDSVFGPINNYGLIINSARQANSDFVALTESYEHQRHFQSYFMFLKKNMISNEFVRDFWMNLENLKSRDDVIQKYEVPFLENIIRRGLKAEALFPYPVVQTPAYCNPTHVFWEHLIIAGFPYLKIDLLRDNPMNLDSIHRWPRYVKDEVLLDIINKYIGLVIN